MVGHGGVDVAGVDPDPVAHPDRLASRRPKVRCSSEQNHSLAPAGSTTVGLPWSIPSDLRPTSATANPAVGLTEITVPASDSAGPKGSAQMAVGGVHQQVRAGLQLGDPLVEVPGAGAAARHDLAPDGLVGGHQQRHRLGHPRLAGRPVLEPDQVALVAHHPPHLETPAPGPVGQRCGLVGRAAAAGEPDVDVDEHLAHPAVGRGVDGLGRVDGHGDPGSGLDQGAEAAGVEHLVGQQQVVAQAGRGHALHLAEGGAAEARVAGVGQVAGQRGRLERLDVGSQPCAGPALRPWRRCWRRARPGRR